MKVIEAFAQDPVVRAQGLALALIGALLERPGPLPPGEFGRFLGIMTTLTAESDSAAGQVLALWTAVASEQERLRSAVS